MVDVLLVNPPTSNGTIVIRDLNRSGRTSREKIIWPQTNLALLAAMVPKNLSVEILDCIAEKMDWNSFKKVLYQKKPKYVLSHVITSSYKNDFNVFKLAKGFGAITMSVGPHVTDRSKESLKECPELDFIIRKEPEVTFKELLLLLEKGESLKNVKGLVYKNSKKIIFNEDRPYLNNLDDLPIPRHDLLPLDKYVFPFISSKFTFVTSSRGCPYHCTFCRQKIMWSKRFRFRSASHIMEELEFLKNIGVNNILFQSDTFTLNKKIILDLCKKIVKKNLNIKWGCNSRVDTIDKEMLYWMKKAGCWMIAYGIESGSQDILDKCRKDQTIQQIIKSINLTNKYGIKIYGYFIIGLPGETKETIKETIKFAKKLPITFAIFHVASPYPGTDLYNDAKENNWLNLSEDLEKVDQGGNSPVNYPDLSAEDVMNGIKKAYLSFYLRPIAVFRILKGIRSFSGLKHLSSIVFEHLVLK